MLKTLTWLTKQICEPSSVRLLSLSERKCLTTHNKSLFLTLSAAFLSYLLCIPLMTDFSAHIHVLNTCFMALLLSEIIILCRSYTKLFHFFITLTFLVYGPICSICCEDGALIAWIAILISPLAILAITGNTHYSIMSIIIQITIQKVYHSNSLLQTLERNGYLDFLEKLTILIIITSVIQITLITSFTVNSQKANFMRFENERFQTSLQNQKTFVQTISHEIRNPLNSLISSIQAAKLELLSSEADELLSTAQVCGELVIHLVSNILDQGKVEVRDLEINPQETRIRSTFENMWRISSELIRRKGLQGFIKIAFNVPTKLKIDPYRLTQIFLNLVGNAVKFTEKGQIFVVVEWIEKDAITSEMLKPYQEGYSDDGEFETLDLKQSMFEALSRPSPQSKGILKLTFKDSGCGMDANSTKKLFQSFVQVNRDENKNQKGTGLGLFITKELCRAMNGEIKVFSEAGEGTSFVVCIPVEGVPSKGSYRKLKTLARIESIKRRKFTAIVADDDPFSLASTISLLNKMHINVIKSGKDGLEAYLKYVEATKQNQKIDLVLLDLHMPMLDGKTACERIRKYEKDHNIEKRSMMLALSGTIEEINDSSLTEDGLFDHVLRKPAPPEEIANFLLGDN